MKKRLLTKGKIQNTHKEEQKKKKITCEEKKHNFLAISNMGNI